MKSHWGLTLYVALTISMPPLLNAQYWGERVLEKGFEQTDFFFAPVHLLPYGIGSFKGTTAGLLSNPLQEIALNPSRLVLDSTKDVWLYTDFRGARNVTQEESPVLPAYMVGYRAALDVASYFPYPRLYLQTRRELEPVFSGGVIVRPLPEVAPALFVCATYQYVLQDEKYYSVPQNIYRTAAGYDFNGRDVAASSSIPIVDKYSGKDEMHQAGHTGSVVVRYSLEDRLDVAGTVSRSVFQRHGGYGSSNFWDQSSTTTSLWGNMELRSQSYAHWDLSGGITYHFNDRIALGGTLGYLRGDAVQALRDNDSSYYSYSTTSPSSSFYNRSSNGLYEWRHAGTTIYAEGDIVTHPGPGTTLSFYYSHQRSDVDLSIGSGILDTSYSTYTWTNNSTPVTSLSQSFLLDNRSGSGTQNISTDRLMGSLQWRIDDKVSLSVGAQLEWYSTEMKTSESVMLSNHYDYSNSTGDYAWHTAQEESKDLLWTFTSKRTSLRIPVFVTIQASKAVQVLLGVNRDMSAWNIDDVTLAMFRYRKTTENATVTRKDNFGERYTVPNENESDVRTTLLAGLTVSPSEKLNLRLLLVPNFRQGYEGQELDQLQLWLGVTVTP
jgi:hypothetical protein